MIDASVLVKWYVQEILSDKALVLRDRHVNGELQLAAPSLITYETFNALKYTDLFSLSDLKNIATFIQIYGLSLYEMEGRVAELGLEASEKDDLTVYDGSYVGLAMNLGAVLVSADQKLIDRLSGDYAKLVKHLKMT